MSASHRRNGATYSSLKAPGVGKDKKRNADIEDKSSVQPFMSAEGLESWAKQSKAAPDSIIVRKATINKEKDTLKHSAQEESRMNSNSITNRPILESKLTEKKGSRDITTKNNGNKNHLLSNMQNAQYATMTNIAQLGIEKLLDNNANTLLNTSKEDILLQDKSNSASKTKSPAKRRNSNLSLGFHSEINLLKN